MADTLESLEIKVQHNASGADAEINGVATAIGRLKTALTGVPAALKELASAVKAVNDAFKGGTAKYDKFAESMLNVATSAELLGENSSHVMTLANAMNTLTSVKVTAGSFNALAKGVEGVGTAAQTITPEAISNLDKMVTSLAKLQGVDLQGLGSAMSAVNRGGRSATPGTATPLPAEMQEMISTASAIDVLEAKLASLHVAMQEAFNSGDVDKALNLRNQILQTEAALERARAAAEKAGKAAKEASNGIKDLAKEAKKSQSPLGNLVSSLKRIAFYRIIRGIIKSITQAFQEGLEKAYLFSAAASDVMGRRFAAAMDSIKSSANAMKVQLGSAFISLLTTLEPIINKIIDLVIKVADVISQVFAAFTGTSYVKANKVATQFVDTMKSGGRAAKEWKNQLLGFDEINRLNAPSDGGGGGGGANPLDGFKFEDAPINEKLLEFVNNIKEKLQPAIDRLKEAFDRLKEAWGKFVDSLGSSAFSQFIEDVLVLASGTVINGLTILTDVLTLLLNLLSGDLMSAEMSFRQLLYDIIVAISDLIVGVTNLAMDALIMLARSIDGILGTHFADDLQADKDAFNAMYRESVTSTNGLFGLKVALGLTEKAAGSVSGETDNLTEALAGVSTEAPKAEQNVSGIRTALDWVLQGFRDFGTEVGYIITSLFQPLADLAGWIERVLEGFGVMQGIRSRVARAEANGSIYLQGFATGGFPDEGQLFMARESGPELVGTMGGRTTVANNQEITEGIRQAVYDAMTASNANGNNDVSVRVYLDSREIKAGQQRLNRAWGVG